MIGVIKVDIKDILREKIIKLALLQHKKIYIHGMHGPDSFDCAGLVWYIYHELLNINLYEGGYGISTTTKIMTSNYGKIVLFNEYDENKKIDIIKSGDILFFHRQSLNEHVPSENNKYPGHCGIYIGNYKFIHALRSEGSVVISNFKNKYCNKKLVSTKDIISTYDNNS